MAEKLGSYKEFLENNNLEPNEEALSRYSDELYRNRIAIAKSLGKSVLPRDLKVTLEDLHMSPPSIHQPQELETISV